MVKFLLINQRADLRIPAMKVLLFFLLSLGWVAAGELRLVSYNIHHGQGMDGKLDLARIARVIKKHQPDFVALQEVDNKASRSGKVDQAAELAKMLGMKHVFGKCINLGGGGYGNAILSKHPILETHVHKLPSKGEARVALEIVTEVSGKKLSFISVHLDHQSNAQRLSQVQAIEKSLATQKHPILMLGDFNAKPSSEPMIFLKKFWRVIPKTGSPLTCPADQPDIEIDYIVSRGFTDPKASSYVGEESTASDHRPLFGVVAWPF